jgi:hypothetical protein
MIRTTSWFVFTTLFVAAIVIAMLSSGCTLIGLGIGSSIDSHAKDSLVIARIGELNRGDAIAITNNSGELIEGEFVRVEKTSLEPKDNIRIPERQLSFFSQISQTKRSGYFAGLDEDTLWVQLEGNGESSPYSLEKVSDISDSRNQALSRDDLHLMAGKYPPMFKRIVFMSVNDAEKSIPLDEVRHLRYDGSQSHRWTWMGIGAAIDAGVVGLIVVLHNSLSWGK